MNNKEQKIAVKEVANAAQTINFMEEQSFDSYFEENTKDLLIKLNEMKEIRDVVLDQ